MKILKVTQTYFNELKQRVIKAWNGRTDTRTAKQLAPYGNDSNPVKDTPIVYMRTELDGKEVIVGCINKNLLAQPGEYRIFSTDENGTMQTYIWLKNAGGIMEIGGNTNWAVKYTELKAEYDKTKSYLLTLRTATQAIATALDALVPGTSTAFINAMLGQVVGDFSLAKNDKIKTN